MSKVEHYINRCNIYTAALNASLNISVDLVNAYLQGNGGKIDELMLKYENAEILRGALKVEFIDKADSRLKDLGLKSKTMFSPERLKPSSIDRDN